MLYKILLENQQPLESHPPETVEHPSVADDTRGIIAKDSPDARAESGAPEFPGGIGGGDQKMYMGMFQMMAMPMKAPEMPTLPNMPSIPGIGGQ